MIKLSRFFAQVSNPVALLFKTLMKTLAISLVPYRYLHSQVFNVRIFCDCKKNCKIKDPQIWILMKFKQEKLNTLVQKIHRI